MNEEMKFEKEYQDIFYEINAPTELYEKVLNMAKIDYKKKTTGFLKKFVAAAAVMVSVTLVGKAIVYAETGSLLEEMTSVAGTIYGKYLVIKQDEHGKIYYEVTYNTDRKSVV